MTCSRRTLWSALVLLGASALFSSTPGHAAGASGSPALFELEVRMQDGGEPYLVTVWEGQAATLRSDRHDLSLVVVPSTDGRYDGVASLWVSEPIGVRPRGVVLGSATEVHVQMGFRQPLAHYPVDVRLVEVRQATRAEMMAARVAEFRSSDTMFLEDGIIITSQGTCCVSCSNGDEFCGCSIRAPCGSCCDGCCGALAK